MAVNGIRGFEAVSPSLLETRKIQNGEDNQVSFSDYLKDAINKVNELQNESDGISDEFAAGRTDSIHQVMIAAEKADIALQFTMQIRNKILDAYNEIMRIQI